MEASVRFSNAKFHFLDLDIYYCMPTLIHLEAYFQYSTRTSILLEPAF